MAIISTALPPRRMRGRAAKTAEIISSPADRYAKNLPRNTSEPAFLIGKYLPVFDKNTGKVKFRTCPFCKALALFQGCSKKAGAFFPE
jgi:hypothetical protein